MQRALERAPSVDRREELIAEYRRKESEFLRFKRTRMTVDDLYVLEVIGKGAFGTVLLLLLIKHALILSLYLVDGR